MGNIYENQLFSSKHWLCSSFEVANPLLSHQKNKPRYKPLTELEKKCITKPTTVSLSWHFSRFNTYFGQLKRGLKKIKYNGDYKDNFSCIRNPEAAQIKTTKTKQGEKQ